MDHEPQNLLRENLPDDMAGTKGVAAVVEADQSIPQTSCSNLTSSVFYTSCGLAWKKDTRSCDDLWRHEVAPRALELAAGANSLPLLDEMTAVAPNGRSKVRHALDLKPRRPSPSTT